MSSYGDFFKNKRITVMGLGLLGRGVGDAEFLAQCGAQIIVTDKKTETELTESVAKLKKYPNVAFHLGGHNIADFTDTDLVMKAGGVSLDSPEIAAARKAGVPVVMSTALFAKYAREAGATIVGVTGTRGKTTVAHMMYRSLIRANKRTVLGGNVRGVSTLAMLPQVKTGDIAVLELDSWQLQGFGELKISPHIAVFTNLMPDHLNYYSSEDAYFSDKANIFRFQQNQHGDALLVGRSVYEQVRKAKPPVEPVVPQNIPDEWTLKVVGKHNRENASFAATALRALDLSDNEIKTGLESFEGVEGRLQFVREVNGIKIYNDNNASTPEATIAALRALKGAGALTLIVGGTDKHVALDGLAREIDASVTALVLFAGSGTEKLKTLLRTPYVEAGSLDDALAAAVSATPEGGTVLFSPAFASFGPFVNYYDRNDKFLEVVRQMGGVA